MLSEPARGPAVSGTALLPAAWIACELCMLAQMAIGTRRSRPHAAPERKRAAQTTCTQAGASLHSHSTGGCSAAEAVHLIDDHRSPRQTSTDEIIDCLCERGTASEGQSPHGGRWAEGERANASECTQELGLKYAARLFDSGGPHRTLSPGTRRQPHIFYTATSPRDRQCQKSVFSWDAAESQPPPRRVTCTVHIGTADGVGDKIDPHVRARASHTFPFKVRVLYHQY